MGCWDEEPVYYGDEDDPRYDDYEEDYDLEDDLEDHDYEDFSYEEEAAYYQEHKDNPEPIPEYEGQDKAGEYDPLLAPWEKELLDPVENPVEP